MPFNRLSSKKDKTGFFPRYFSRQLTAFDFTLNLLMKDNKAEVLANSRLTTINGREANIKLVDIVPYILSSGGVGGQVQVQREEVGIKLNILPTVNTDGFITVKVEPEVSTIFEFICPDNNIPRVKSRTSSTTIRVKNGESIIIGGLISNDKNLARRFTAVSEVQTWSSLENSGFLIHDVILQESLIINSNPFSIIH